MRSLVVPGTLSGRPEHGKAHDAAGRSEIWVTTSQMTWIPNSRLSGVSTAGLRRCRYERAPGRMRQALFRGRLQRKLTEAYEV
jgi:hypothetical protein